MPINTERYDNARQKADLAALVVQEMGIARHATLLDAIAKGLLSDPLITSARIISTNASNDSPLSSVWWRKPITGVGIPEQVEESLIEIDLKIRQQHPWLEVVNIPLALQQRPSKFNPGLNSSQRGVWTFPYFSCSQMQWILSYTVVVPPIGRHG